MHSFLFYGPCKERKRREEFRHVEKRPCEDEGRRQSLQTKEERAPQQATLDLELPGSRTGRKYISVV